MKVRELYFENFIINIAEYKTRKIALCDEIIDDGAHIGAECEKINGRLRPLYNVNMSCFGRTPVTISATFIKDNYQTSITAKCPEHINRGINYPANAPEFRQHYWANQKNIEETGKPLDIEKNIPHLKELVLKYTNEILTVFKQIENFITKL